MEKKNLLLSSLFFSFTFCFFAPVELYLTNRQEFWFDIQKFIWIPIVMTIVVFGVLYFIGCIRSQRVKSIWTALVFSGASLTYIQGNFLNRNVGIMNGMLIEWEKYRKLFIGNWLIWILFTLFILIWYTRDGKYTKKIVAYVSLFAVLIQLFTVSVLYIMESVNNSGSVDR